MVFRALFSKYSVIFTWLMSYILILFISILIALITYNTTVKVVENQVSQSNILLLKQSQRNMDKVIGEAESLSAEISFNANIQDILSYNTPLSNDDYYNITRTMKNLAVYKNTYRSINDFYIHFKKIDIVLSPNGATDEKNFYEAYYKESGISFDKWHSINEGKYYGSYILSYGKDNKKGMLLYARSLPLLENDSVKATIYIKLDESKLIERVNGIEDINGATAFIIDKDNNIISSTRDLGSAEKIDYTQVTKDSGSFHKLVNGENMIVSYITSKNSNWKYITMTPSSFFWSEVQYVKKYTAISIILFILIGGIVAAFMIKKNYNPVLKLVKEFEKQVIPSGNRKQNEYLFIQDALTGIMLRETQMEIKLEDQNVALRSAFLARLFKGDFRESTYIKKHVLSLNFNFVTDYFVIFLLYDEMEVGIFQDTVNLINGILTEVLNEEFKVYITEVDGITTRIINFKREPLNLEIDGIMNKIRKCQNMIIDKYKAQLSISISNIHKGVENIPKAFYEAVQVMEYKKIMGVETNLCFCDMSKYSSNKLSYSLIKEEHLVNFIKAGDIVNSEIVLIEILDKESKCKKTNKALKMNLISMIITIINDNTISKDKYFNLLCMTEELIKLNSLQELKEKMMEIIKVIIENLQRNSENVLKLKDKIIKYISGNSTNPDLNISSIAEYLNMHPVYISQVFREQTGEGILDYINKNRIKSAKKLLQIHEYTLDMVTKEVGYSNTRTFIRAFKKYEGVNPGCYKDNNKACRDE